jgi:hypothetical protein
MNRMSITLSCRCGQQQYVADELAGQSVACVMCGATMTAPAMGVVHPSRPRPKHRPKAARVPMLLVSIVLAVFALLLLSIGGGLIWWTNREALPETPITLVVSSPQAPRGLPESQKKAELVEPLPGRQPAAIVIEPTTPKTVNVAIPLPDPPRRIAIPFKDPPAVAKNPKGMEALKLVWKLREGDEFFQELIVTQKPTFKVGGLPVASLLNYRIVSRFSVKKRQNDGALIVEQKIESAKLLMADDLSKSAVEGAIAKLPGTNYTLHLSPAMEVVKFEGASPTLNFNAFGAGFQMASLIDRDGWKELAQATFFQLDQTPKANLRWSKPMTHNWGGLGSWNGQIRYAYLGPQANLHRISYGLQLKYKSPAAGAVGLMTVNGADFLPPEAGGVLLFNAERGRVVTAEERFRVRGVVNANVLGQNTRIEIEEDQHFLIRIHDKQP